MTNSQEKVLDLIDLGVRKLGTSKIAVTKIFDPNSCIREDGSMMNFDTQLAIVTHFAMLQNDTRDVKHYSTDAQKLMELWSSEDSIHSNDTYMASEALAMQSYLFHDIFKAPFQCSENADFKFIDLFAGIGGFRLALQSVGGKCVFSSEWDKQAQKTYFANYGEVPFGDITKAETKKIHPRQF